MEPQHNRAKRQERYAYMFKSGRRRFLFVRNFGAGVESVAQLVQDVETGENLIRKVTGSRPTQVFPFIKPFRPKKPNEVVMIDTIFRDFPAASRHTAYICNFYAHEYIKSQATDPSGYAKYHSISYWKLCNGRSVRSRWLTGDVVPPIVAVARMVADVLGTLQYLYTAGKKPVYHHDIHLGNVWMSWSAHRELPTFYLGDFADASFAGQHYYSEESMAEPVNDLHKFWCNLGHVISKIGESRGYDNPGTKALRRLANDMGNVVGEREQGDDSDPPPDLTPLIQHALHLVESFGEGGIADETQTPAYINFVNEEREKAFEVDKAKPWVVGSIQEALHPAQIVGSQSVPMAVHGPWYLVKASDDGRGWVRVEPKGVTHHRPNRTHVAEEDLSRTVKPPTFVPFLEPESSNGRRLKQDESESFELSSDYRTAKTTPSLVAASPDPPSPKLSHFLSWTAGDENIQFQEAHSEGVPRTSPASSYHEGDDDKFETRQLRSDQFGSRPIALHTGGNQTPGEHHPKTSERVTGEALENKMTKWHALVHEDGCECSETVWTRDLEDALVGKRERSVPRDQLVLSNPQPPRKKARPNSK
ncbi:hypothetical protein NEMBOFW57_002056 [Staphylotrichum longicolle]|uniref:Protein kinase domain-containing protein n=1 Tax=Staphylotrichum longicolle TaxID=669026 RepID=A0AAD4F3I7_9PEZI|nr:hypothetical protein NEMBOFW57_002056 [Staphylotrichum longicolle]